MSKPGGANGHEHSFADVLNSLNNGPRRTRGSRETAEESPVEQLVIPWLPASRPAAEQDNWQDAYTGYEVTGSEAGHTAPPAAEVWGEPEDFASAVRPYTWTRGRTRPVYDLEVETLVSTSAQGRDVAALTSVEHRAVAELCLEPRSVAEVAALLVLPLGVARVLLADMANIGLVVVHHTATTSGEVPEFGFMERVLSGLRRL
ncbi:MAG: DUF742 domain-containing protein [Pseudonocardiaceae bacterium]